MTRNELAQRAGKIYGRFYVSSAAAVLMISALIGKSIGDLAVLLMMLVLGFYVGALVIGLMLWFVIKDHPDVQAAEPMSQAEKVQLVRDYGEARKSGKLSIEQIAQLDEHLAKLGYSVGPELIEVGPVIGKYKEADVHDWVHARLNPTAPTYRYEYVGMAKFDNDNVARVEDITTDIVIDGSVYRRGDRVIDVIAT